jgi:hypothetical protein
MPTDNAITTARTEPNTDIEPLMPHSHGVSAGERLEANPMPIGKAIPMKNPIGKKIEIEIRMRTGVVAPWKPSLSGGVNKPKTTNMPTRSARRVRADR